MSHLQWGWPSASMEFAAFGNTNDWAIASDLDTVAREACQNSLDAIRSLDPDLTGGLIELTVIRLQGEDKSAFETLLQWSDVAGHLQSMARAVGQSNAAGQLATNLELAAGRDELVLLRIDDYGGSGLGGPEFPDDDTDPSDYGNFIKLLRTDLFSDKAAASGGSYGLGKAVYWRYSRFHTALFASRPAEYPAEYSRFIGVCQGFNHSHDGRRYDGRGYFGLDSTPTTSAGVDDDLLAQLHLRRKNTRPGTSVLIVGFYDPDEPDADVDLLVDRLRRGIERNFWPLLARDRLEIRLCKSDNGTTIPVPLQIGTRYAELSEALRAFDDGRRDDDLAEPGDVLVVPVPIAIPARKTSPSHEAFTHEAQLVITLSDTSDDSRDDLENTVSLFRGPEMVVEVLEKELPGQTYHAFLVAGRAITPTSPTDDDLRADDFLRNAEPPSHDQWIPRQGMRGAPKVNLSNNYRQPYVMPLRKLREQVLEALRKALLLPPPESPDGPHAVIQHLRFLTQNSTATGALRKPVIDLLRGHIADDGAWVVEAQADMANRPGGWMFRPDLQFAGDDGQGVTVPVILEEIDGCTIDGDKIVVAGRPTSRRLTATFRMRTRVEHHPIPSSEAAVTVDVRDLKLAEGGVSE